MKCHLGSSMFAKVSVLGFLVSKGYLLAHIKYYDKSIFRPKLRSHAPPDMLL